MNLSKFMVVIGLSIILQGCAALSAVKGLLGDGANNSIDKSVKVEANLAARDNKKSLVSHESTRTYNNGGNVIRNGVQVRGNSLVGIMVATAAQAADVLLLVFMYFLYKSFSIYMSVKADIYERKLKCRLDKKNKTIN